MSTSEQNDAGSPPPALRPGQLLRIRAIWVMPLVISGVLVFLMTLFYIGSVVNPVGHLSGLPVALVDQDQGATVLGHHVDIGAEIAAGLESSRALSTRLSLDAVSLREARQQMNTNGAYAAIVIPADFTDSLLAAYGLTSSGDTGGKPTVRILTNPRAGSIGVSLATGVATPALQAASLKVGSQLTSEANSLGRTISPGINAAAPLTVASTAVDPLPPDSALGLSAFDISLLSIMCGFLGAILVHTTVDSAVGVRHHRDRPEVEPAHAGRHHPRPHPAVEMGRRPRARADPDGHPPPRVGRPPRHERCPTSGSCGSSPRSPASPSPRAPWPCSPRSAPSGSSSPCCSSSTSRSASSGGTIPLQALPTPFRFVANFEPLRQVLDGVRSILYFGAQGAAGLTRGVVLTAIGLVFWLLVGLAVTTWYDRRGKDRMQPEMLAYVQESAAVYRARGDVDAGPAPGAHPGPSAGRPDPGQTET